MSRYWNIIWYFDIDFFLPTYGQFAILCHRYEIEQFRAIIILFGNLHHNVRLGWFRYLDCIVLFIIQVDSIFIMRLTHLTLHRRPFDTSHVFSLSDIQLLPKPSPQANQMNVPYGPSALTGADEGVGEFPGFQADSTGRLTISFYRLDLFPCQFFGVM